MPANLPCFIQTLNGRVLTCWLSSTRIWFIEPSHSLGSPLTSVSLRCSQMQETSSGLAESSNGMTAMSSSNTWICAGCLGLNSGGSDTETAQKFSYASWIYTKNTWAKAWVQTLAQRMTQTSKGEHKDPHNMLSVEAGRDTNESQTS